MVRNVFAVLIAPSIWFALAAVVFILPVATTGANLITQRRNSDQLA